MSFFAMNNVAFMLFKLWFSCFNTPLITRLKRHYETDFLCV